MKKGSVLTVISSFVMGMGITGLCIKLYRKSSIIVNTDKFKRYYNLLIKWMQMREEKILLEDCFVNKQYYRVIIYGIGEIGELVYKELRKSEKISVVCGIDQNSNLYLEGLEIKGIDDIPINADVIVVTPVFAFEEIQEILRKKTNLNIVSLEEIISV